MIVLWAALAAPLLCAADLSGYRGFLSGMTLVDVQRTTDIHQRFRMVGNDDRYRTDAVTTEDLIAFSKEFDALAEAATREAAGLEALDTPVQRNQGEVSRLQQEKAQR